MAALHEAGGVPPGWKFTPPPGNPSEGRKAFAELGCYTCHVVQGESFPPPAPGEPAVGPELSGMGTHHPPEYFVESILNPDAVLVDGTRSQIIPRVSEAASGLSTVAGEVQGQKTVGKLDKVLVRLDPILAGAEKINKTALRKFLQDEGIKGHVRVY